MGGEAVIKAFSLCLILAGSPVALLYGQDSTLVVGTVVSREGSPLPYSTYSISPPGVHRFTNADGAFSLRVPSHQSVHIAIKQLGYAPLDTTIAIGASSAAVHLRFALRGVAFRLAAVRAVGHRSCATDIRTTELAGILEEVEKNAERELLLRESYPFEYRLERTQRSAWGSVDRYRRDTSVFISRAFDPYRPGGVVRETFAEDGAGREMRIPQLTDFSNDAFLANHCFSYGGLEKVAGAQAYRIDFEPARDVRGPDVEGAVLLDTATLLIRRAVFSLTGGDRVNPPVLSLEVSTTYRELFKGVAIFDHIRSVQSFVHVRPTDVIQSQTEEQRLVGVRFLGQSPEGVTEPVVAAANVESRRSTPVPAIRALTPAQRTDSLHRMIGSLMAADLQRVGYFDRKSRFPRATFIGFDEIERRIVADSARLLPEVRWVELGATGDTGPRPGGITISFPECAVNVYVNGKVQLTRDAQAVRVRNPKIIFGPELSPSKLGAIELYPAGSGVPAEFPLDSPRCGTILLWTRPEASASRSP